jgi:uncharacterized membrane protein YeaQ/YmgE (transglycosylase-associated protein family)
MIKILLFLGLPSTDSVTLITVIGVLFGAAVIFGWLADTIMEQNSFGVVFNGIILILGAGLGLWLLKHSAFHIPTNFTLIATLAAASCAAMLLLLMAFSRRFF